MKQKLLLALFVLFASVGAMRAQTTITLPAGSPQGSITVSGIPSGKTITITGATPTTNEGKSSATFTISPNNTAYTIALGTDATYTGLVINGQVTEAKIDHDNLTSVDFQNNGKKLTTLTLTKGKLTTLTCNDCGLTSMPTLTADAFGSSATISLKSNEIIAVSSYPDITGKTATINLDGNKIVGAIPAKNPSTSKVTVNYGTQYLSYTTPTVANEYFPVMTNLVTSKIYTGTPALVVADLSVTWKKQNGSAFSPKTNSAGDVVFYSSNEYLDGVVECQIKNTKHTDWPTYVYSMTVVPAKFTLVPSAGDGGTLGAKKAGVVVSGKISKGDVITFSPKANEGFIFDKYDNVKGLTVTTADPNQYLVKGDGEQPTVSINATFKALQYKVTHSGGEHGTYTAKCDGEIFTSGSSVTYGKVIEIEAKSEANYDNVRVLVNDKEVTVSGKKASVTIDKTLDPDLETTSKDIKIEVIFESSTAYTLTLKTNTNVDDVIINGGNESDITSNDVDIDDLKPGSKVTVAAKGINNHTIKQVLLNTTPLEGTTNVVFTMPEGNATLTFVTVKEQEITITAATTPDYIYTGVGQAFRYTVEPIGITGLDIKYAPENSTNFTATLPINVGKYDVKVTRPKDETYAKYESTNLKMEIKVATPEISTLPTITVGDNNKYAISGGSAKLGSKTLTGTFEVTNDGTGAVTSGICTKSESHIADVTYTVTGADKNNFTTETVKVPVKYKNTDAVKTFKVQWEGLPSDMTLTVLNGSFEVKSGTTVAEGTELTFILKYPLGYTTVVLKEKKANADDDLGETAVETTEGAYAVKTITYSIPATGIETLTVSYAGKPTTKKFGVTIKTPVAALDYTPDGQASLYAKTNFAISLDGTELTSSSTPKLDEVQAVITYKDASGKIIPTPINVGKYTVCLHIPAMSGTDYSIAETNLEFKDKLEIIQATVAIDNADWPTTALIGVNQTLKDAIFEGGSAPVAGQFKFVDGSIVPVDGVNYGIKFVPTDTNYKEVVSTTTATATVSNKRILLIDKMENGTVEVKDKATSTIYKNGAELPASVKELIITATPSTGYKTEILTVNGSSITSGGSYTLGVTSVKVTATFEQYFTVSVTAPTKGLVVTLPASKDVKKGGSYVITLAHLAGDRPVVKDGSTTITGVDGKYTISNIMANKAITITLDAPTAIAVKADATLSPQGRPMGTIVLTGLTDGKCYYGDKITAKATPVSGVQFSGWNGLTSTENPLTMTVTGTLTLKALYLGSPTGIDDIEGTKIYGAEGYIYVSCEGQATVTVVAMDGRSQQVRIVGEARIETGAGIYGVILQQGAEVLKMKVVVR